MKHKFEKLQAEESLKPTNSLWTVDKKEDEPDLKRAQRFVCGYIACVQLEDGDCLIVNEEGKLHQLPINVAATKLWRKSNPLSEDYMVGNVIYIKKEARKSY